MPEHPELDWLGHDIAHVRALLKATPQIFAPLGDVRDPNRHARYLAVADLTWQLWLHAIAVHELLRQGLYSPAFVVLRAVFECLVNLRYLVDHPHSQDEAIILLAFAYARDIGHFSHQDELVKEYSDILGRMLPNLVSQAEKRARTRPHTWSGKTIKKMAEEAQIAGYDPTYGFMSAEAHAVTMGRHVRTIRDGDKMKIETGRQVSPLDVESTANFARRALHVAFKTLWHVFDGPRVTFPSTDPEDWRRPPGS